MALSPARARRLVGCASLIVLAAACAGGRRIEPVSEPAGATMGVYRAALEERGRPERRFRLLLYAALPDRIHGEVLSPVGTTEAIVDGGGGRVAVTLPRRGLSYVGSGEADALQKVLGVRLSLEQLVGVLLGTAESSADYRSTRRPAVGAGLPQALTVEGDAATLTLRLKQERPLRASTVKLGHGEPPAGMEVRPLEELLDFPWDDGPDGERAR